MSLNHSEIMKIIPRRDILFLNKPNVPSGFRKTPNTPTNAQVLGLKIQTRRMDVGQFPHIKKKKTSKLGTGDTEYIVLGAQNDPDICTTSRSPASPRLCFSDCCSSPQKERKAKREPNWPQVPESYRIPEGLTSSNIIATMYPGVVGLAHSKHLSERVPYMAAVHPAGFITKSLVCLASKDISLTCS